MAKGRKQSTKNRSDTQETNGSFSRSDWRKAGMTREQHKYCANIIKSLKQYKHVGPFLDPVDPVKLNVPDYFDIIKTPMDLGTVERRLNNCEYESTMDFAADVRTIFNNCYVYNGEHATISQFAKDMEEIFNTAFAKMPGESISGNPAQTTAVPKTPKTPKIIAESSTPKTAEQKRPKREIRPPPSKDLPDTHAAKRRKPSKKNNDLNFCRSVLKELRKKQHYPYAYPFYEPVDAEKLQVPDYYTVIKQPRDLQTIGNKLENDQYENAKAFEDDIRLMFRNCYTYNPPGSDVYRMGQQLEAVFDKKWREKPVPQQRAPSVENLAEEDESQQHLKALQKHLAALSTQIASMAKPLKTKPKKSSKSSKTPTRKNSTKSVKETSVKKPVKKPRALSTSKSTVDEQVPLTAEQKNDLSDRIGLLTEEGMADLIELIRESGAPLEAQNGNYELEIESVNANTARKIYDFVLSHTTSQKPPTKKQRLAYDEEEQQRQIEKLESQLKKFEGATAEAHAPGTTQTQYIEYSNYDASPDQSNESETSDSSGTETEDSVKRKPAAKKRKSEAVPVRNNTKNQKVVPTRTKTTEQTTNKSTSTVNRVKNTSNSTQSVNNSTTIPSRNNGFLQNAYYPNSSNVSEIQLLNRNEVSPEEEERIKSLTNSFLLDPLKKAAEEQKAKKLKEVEEMRAIARKLEQEDRERREKEQREEKERREREEQAELKRQVELRERDQKRKEAYETRLAEKRIADAKDFYYEQLREAQAFYGVNEGDIQKFHIYKTSILGCTLPHD
ncbi:11928_t:CDS:10 [Ambispora leptoticha]|uniref:11928_t:CDS:1 n=1 Tax=Ambispora leptoticha TaxID=144679 RepID=A0A9N8V9Y2_9GLOM|nr:11928_t:CDS:10 [Ambispora leptoticha]